MSLQPVDSGERRSLTSKASPTPCVIAIASILAVSLSSCSGPNFDGEQKQATSIITAHGTVLNQEVSFWDAPGEAKVLGSENSVCLVMADNVELRDAEYMSRLLARYTKGAKIDMVLLMSSGNRVELSEPSPSWSEDGVVLRHNEFAACASPPCATVLPIGTSIRRIEISASTAVSIKGIYWQSGADFSKPPTQGARPQQSKTNATCASGSDP